MIGLLLDRYRRARAQARYDQLSVEFDAAEAAIGLKMAMEVLESWEDDEDDSDKGLIGGGMFRKAEIPYLTTTIADLGHARNLSRMLVRGHYKARGALRNTRNLVLGAGGMQVKLKGERASEAWWAWSARERWRKREREALWRLLRDGEMLLRFFDDGARLRVRFVDPENLVGSMKHPKGVETEPDDVETPVAFWIRRSASETDAERVPAAECVWAKVGTDANEMRGLPWLFCLLNLLQRQGNHLKALMASAVLRNAYAIVHKHKAGPQQIADHVARIRTGTREVTDSGTKRTIKRQVVRPGTHLHVGAGDDVDFKSPNIEAGDQVKLCREMDLAGSQGTGLAEHYYRMDTEARTMAGVIMSEGPTEAMVLDLQAVVAEDIVRPVLLKVMESALTSAAAEIATGEAAPEAIAGEAVITGPRFPRRDRDKQVVADLKLYNAGAISLRTVQIRDGLDPDEEKEQIAQDEAASGVYGDGGADDTGEERGAQGDSEGFSGGG